MKGISVNINKYKIKTSNITSERQLVIQQFLEKLNAERVNFKPLTPARIGMLLSQMNTSQLKQFYSELCQSKNFSSSFWWRINPKNYD